MSVEYQPQCGRPAALPDGGGAMGALTRAHDWAATPLGPVAAWPHSLRTVISLVLEAHFPMLALWGPDLIQFYNDAFRPILGATKHPAALGQRASACWSEIWDEISPLLARVWTSGEAVAMEDLPLLLDRFGYLEETHFAFSYSPIRDDTGAMGGILVTCIEMTERVLSERRLRTLHDLTTRTAATTTLADACTATTTTLAENQADIPWAALYLLDAAGAEARLAATTGLDTPTLSLPACADLTAETETESEDGWPLARAARTEQAILVEDPTARADTAAIPGGETPPRRALILPVAQGGQDRAAGLLLVGLSPYHVRDDTDQHFFKLLASHIATALANSRAREEERQRAAALARLQILQAISEAAFSQLALPALLREVLERMMAALEADNTAVLLLDEADNALVVYAAQGPEEAQTGQMRVPVGQGVAGHIAATRQPLIVPDLCAVEPVNPLLREQMASLMGVPLVAGGRLIGVMHVDAATPRQFSEDELHLLQLVADRVALALDNARLYSAALEAGDQVTRLQRLTAALSAALSTAEVVDVIIGQGLAALGASGGTLALRSDDGATFTTMRALGYAPEVVAAWPDVPVDAAVPIADAVRAREPVILASRADHDARYPHLADVHATVGDGALVAIPLLGARVVGGLGLSFATARRFSAAEQAAMTTLGVLCTQALERAQIHEAARASAARARARSGELETLLAVLPVGIGIARDPTGADIRVNPAFARMLGIPPDANASLSALAGEHPTSVRAYRRGRELEAAELPLQQAAARGITIQDFEVELVRTDGVRLTLLEYAAPLYDDEGHLRGSVGAFLDISERKRLEEGREAFLGAAAHDLKTPLTAIRGLAQLAQRRLAREGASERVRADLAGIQEGTDRMAALINELLDVMRMEMGGGLDLQRRPTDLVDLVRGCVAEQQAATDRPITLEQRGGAVLATVDGVRLARVVGNLLSNAVKYSPDGGTVRVRVEQVEAPDGAVALIVVADQGLGIPAADLPHIFARFARGANVVGRVEGTGIGLASARGIVEQHGGTITVESIEGVGSTFTVRLPLAPVPPA